MAYDQTTVNGDRTRAWAQAALEQEAERVRHAPEHEANLTLNRASYSLGQIAGEGLLQATDIEDTLLKAAQARKIPKGEARRTIKSGLRAGQRKPRGPSQDAWRSPDAGSGRREAAADHHQADGRAFATRIWREAAPIENTAAERYLRQRGIEGELPSSLRFHAEAPMPDRSRHPALLAAVTDPITGEFLAVHRIALRADGSGKADISPAKATLGSSHSGAVVFGPLGDFVAEGEGIETVLSAIGADVSAIATLSASTLGRARTATQTSGACHHFGRARLGGCG